jgi:2-haloacid dehalogenase
MVLITAIVFDLGGVLIDWNPAYLYRYLIPDPDERARFLATICSPEWNHEMDGGRPVPAAVAELADAHPDYAPLIEAWWTRWPEMLGGEIPGTRVLAEAIARTGRPVYALTNWSAETWPYGLQRYPFIEQLFSGVVVSGQERIAKPDPHLFEILNDRYNLNPSTVVYIDDSTDNIDTASSLGYITHHFTTADRLRNWVNELRLLPTR